MVFIELAQAIARRSRGTARIAINHLLWYRDVVQGDGGVATMALLALAFEMKGIDGYGLTKMDRDYLRRLVESGEAVGAETMAMALGESVETLEESIEPFLLREGYIDRTPRGRVAMAAAYEHIGLTPPAAGAAPDDRRCTRSHRRSPPTRHPGSPTRARTRRASRW